MTAISNNSLCNAMHNQFLSIIPLPTEANLKMSSPVWYTGLIKMNLRAAH